MVTALKIPFYAIHDYKQLTYIVSITLRKTIYKLYFYKNESYFKGLMNIHHKILSIHSLIQHIYWAPTICQAQGLDLGIHWQRKSHTVSSVMKHKNYRKDRH